MTGSLVNAYSALAIAGLLLTAWLWGRLTARDGRHDLRLTLIYFCGLLGAVVGAKLAFLFAEGWHHRDDWMALVTGRSITGALLGGYAAVELAKKWQEYPRATGDVFAIIVPAALVLGRAGCVLAGCCSGVICPPHWWTVTDSVGVTRWPAAQMELLFNVVFIVWALAAGRRHWTPGNRFHVYLIAYGGFRFVHEFVRDDALLIGPLTGYHLMALALVAFGVVRFIQRRRSTAAGALPVGITSTAST